MRALAVALLLSGGCTAPPRDGALACGPNVDHPCPAGYACVNDRCYTAGHEFDLAVPLELEDMALADLAVELPSPDLTASDDLASTCAATAGQPCCPATAEEAAALPSPPGGLQKGVGRCAPAFACAQASCAAHTTCADGSYNGSPAMVYVIYCVAL
jgi:hypothetical protein